MKDKFIVPGTENPKWNFLGSHNIFTDIED